MSRYERATYLDRLIELRAAYAARDVADQVAVMTIAEVAAFADRLLSAVAATPASIETATSEADALN